MLKSLKLTAGFLIVIFLALLVYAAGDLSITHTTATTFTVNPGDVISGNFSMTNSNATDALIIDFPNPVDMIGSSYNYTANVNYNESEPYILANNSAEDISYDMTIPSDTYAGSYSSNVNITAGTGNWDNFNLAITVNPISNMSVSDMTTSVVRGYGSTGSINLTNIGNTDITGITYIKSDLVKDTDTIPQANIALQSVSSVNYRNSGIVNATITVPSDQATGVYNGNITVNYDGKTVISDLIITIEPVSMSLTATDGSATWVTSLSTSETTVFTINNTGNVDLTNVNWTIGTLTYGSNNLTATITPDTSSVALLTPDQTQDVTLTIAGIPTNQTAGDYTGDITVNWGDSNQTVSTLTVKVQEPSYSIITIPDTVNFGEVDQNSTSSISFNITNNGNAPLSGVSLASTLASKYNIQLNPTSIGALAVNESRQVNVNVTIPIDEDTDYHSLGSISLTSNEYNKSISLYADVRGRLEISDIDVWVDGDSDKNLDDGQEIGEKARPMSTVKFDIRLDNRFTDDEDIEIEDIEVTITIEEIDDGDELEETLEEFDLRADKHNRVEHEFEVPLAVDEGTYNVIIFAEGEDEEGVRHTDEVTIKLEVDKESHDIVIDNVRLYPEEVSCGDYTSLEVSITNIGSRSEDEVVLSISSTDLGININEQVELDEDPDDDENNFEKTYSINIPSNIAPEKYPIDIRVYYDMDEISDYTREYVTIDSCGESDEEDESETGETEETVVLETGDEGDITPPVIQPETESWLKEPATTLITFTKSNAYLALLVLANITLVGVVGIMVIKFLFIK